MGFWGPAEARVGSEAQQGPEQQGPMGMEAQPRPASHSGLEKSQQGRGRCDRHSTGRDRATGRRIQSGGWTRGGGGGLQDEQKLTGKGPNPTGQEMREVEGVASPPFPAARLGGPRASLPRLDPVSFMYCHPQPGQDPGPATPGGSGRPPTAGPQLSGGSFRDRDRLQPDSCAVPSPQQGRIPVSTRLPALAEPRA